jgi:hypothetical protein
MGFNHTPSHPKLTNYDAYDVTPQGHFMLTVALVMRKPASTPTHWVSPPLFAILRTLEMGKARVSGAGDFFALQDAGAPFPFSSCEYPFSVLSSSSSDLCGSLDSDSEFVVLMVQLQSLWLSVIDHPLQHYCMTCLITSPSGRKQTL